MTRIYTSIFIFPNSVLNLWQMNTYSLKLKPHKKILGNLPSDRLIAFGISIFLLIVTIGVIYFGRTNYFFAFCIMLSIYGVLLVYLLAKMEYQSLLPSKESYKHLQLLSSNFPHLEVLISSKNNVLYQNKPTIKGNTFTNKKVIELSISKSLTS